MRAGMHLFFRCLAWVLVLVVAGATLSPIELRPVTSAPADIERVVAFGLIGASFWLGYPQRRGIVLVVIGLAGLLEAAQMLVPGRHGTLHDFLVKGLGALAGALIAAFLQR